MKTYFKWISTTRCHSSGFGKILFLTFLSFVVPQCHIDRNFSRLSDLTCRQILAQFEPGKELGRGVQGRVFEMKSVANGQVSDDMVLKIVLKNKSQSVTRIIEEEKALTELLGSLYAGVKYSEEDSLLVNDQKIFRGFLIKVRVNGYTPAQLITLKTHEPARFQELKPLFHDMYQQFLSFRHLLTERVAFLARDPNHNLFLWDFHPHNIMYDIKLKKWIVIDASYSHGYAEFMTKIEKGITDFEAKNQKANIVLYKDIDKLFRNAANRLHDPTLFDQYLRLYFDPIEKFLKKMSQVETAI